MTTETAPTERNGAYVDAGQNAPEMFAAIINSFDDAIIGWNLDGYIKIWNPAAERLYGYKAPEVLGRFTSFLFPPDRLNEIGEALDVLRRGERLAHHDTKRVRKDGTVLDVSVTASPIRDETGAVVALFGTHRDIAERIALERAQAALQSRAHQYERLESLGELAGGIAHDFNNLLAVISHFASFVSDELDDETAARADLEKIQEAARRANVLTRQLRSFARRDVIAMQVIDLNDVITKMETLLRGTLAGNISFVISLAPGLSAIEADAQQLEEILVHLVTNARDAMPDGGVLTIETENIEIDSAYAQARPGLVPGHYALLRVSDNGTGMEPSVLEHAFEPFFTTKPRGAGTGLGLPMVFGIVAQAGGDIELSSQLGTGTTCRVLLPTTSEPARRVDRDTALRTPREQETVLVVEDEAPLREATGRILTRNGYKALVFASGPEAIAAVKEHPERIDLLISDVIMPEMSGSEVAARIAELVPGIAVLFVSGYARPVLGPRVDDETALLAKPFSSQALLAKIREVIDKSQSSIEGT